MIEERIEKLEARIARAKELSEHAQLEKTDIHAFTEFARNFMEHPRNMLKNNDNLQTQAALAGLIFEQLPTYREILNETPKLTPVFALNHAFKQGKSLSVTQQSLEWNTWERMIEQWKCVFNVINDPGSVSA